MRFRVGIPIQLIARLQQYPEYWAARAWCRDISFRLARRRLRLVLWLDDQWIGVLIAWQLLKTILGQLLVALGLVAVLWMIEHRFPRYFSNLDSPIRIHVSIESTQYVDLMGAASQIAGVFLGLYFATIGVVLSTSYSRTAHRIRQLIIQEHVGTRYIQWVALFGTISWLLYGLAVAGQPPLRGGIAVVTLLGLISILSFVVLGLRLFRFLDPTVLSDRILHEASKWVSRAHRTRYRADDPSFQDFYRRQCSSLLTTYGELARQVVRTRETTDSDLTLLSMRALSFLARYSSTKSAIPTSSKWYPDRLVHPDWFRTSGTELDLALSASITIQPRRERHYSWVEAALRRSAGSIMAELRTRGELERVHEILVYSSSLAQLMARNCATSDVLDQVWFAREVAKAAVGTEPIQCVELTALSETRLQELAILESLGSHIVRVILGIVESVQSNGRVVTVDQLIPRNWSKPKGIASISRPRGVVAGLEDLVERLENERVVEGRVVDPEWYARHVTAHAYAQYVVDALDTMLTALEMLVDDADEFLRRGDVIRGMQLVMQGLEGVKKAEYHTPTLRDFASELHAARGRAELPPWPTVDWESSTDRLSTIAHRVAAQLALAAQALAVVDRSENVPDMFGLAYNHLAQEIYAATWQLRVDRYRPLFAGFFAAAFRAYEHRRVTLVDAKNERDAATVLDLVSDVVDLSGVAVVADELHKSSLREVVDEVWMAFLSQSGNPKDILASIVEMFHSRRRSLWGTPRSLVRMSWQQDLERRFLQRGVVGRVYDPTKGGFRIEGTDSALLVALGAGEMIQDPPGYAFLAWFLQNHPELADLPLPDEVRRFVERVDRLKKRLSNDV